MCVRVCVCVFVCVYVCMCVCMYMYINVRVLLKIGDKNLVFSFFSVFSRWRMRCCNCQYNLNTATSDHLWSFFRTYVVEH